MSETLGELYLRERAEDLRLRIERACREASESVRHFSTHFARVTDGISRAAHSTPFTQMVKTRKN